MKYRAKHAKTMKLHHFKKSAVLLIALALIVTVGVGSTLAYLIDTSTEVTNTFQPSEVTCRVDETFKDNVKSAVRIQNVKDNDGLSDTEAYIRAAIVVTWKDADRNVYGQKPVAGEDYTIQYEDSWENGSWIKGADGYYYWTLSVPVGGYTGDLIDTCTSNNTKTVDDKTYYLSVEIVAEAIQSKPASAVDSWDNEKVNVTGNNAGTKLTVTNK